MEAHEEHNAAS